MSNKQKDGLKYQKKAARKLGGKYLSKSFIGDSLGDIDIGENFHVESKLVKKLPKYLEDVLRQSFIDSLRGFKVDGESLSAKRSKWSIGIIQERGRPWRDNVVIMKAGDFCEMVKLWTKEQK